MTQSNITDPFHQFLETFAVLLAATRQVAALDAEVNGDVDAIIEAQKDPYLAALATKKSAEDALKEWAKMHPEWFGDKRTLTTPHGSISKRLTTSLKIPNEALTISLILKAAGITSIAALLGSAAEYLHIEITPNREALEKLPERQLKRWGIRTVEAEAFTVKTSSVDLGKSVVTKPAKAKAVKEAA